MTLNDWRKVANQQRAIPGGYGLRRFRVFVVQREWTGTYVGDGLHSDVVDELLEAGHPPKVRALSGEELAVNGLSGEVYEVGPFTPQWTEGTETGGVTLESIVPTTNGAASERLYRITGEGFGENGRLFVLEHQNITSNFRYVLRLRPVEAEG